MGQLLAHVTAYVTPRSASFVTFGKDDPHHLSNHWSNSWLAWDLVGSDFGLRNTVKSHSLRVLIILAALVMFNSLTLPNFIVVHIPHPHHSTSTCFKGCTSIPGECWKCSSRIPKRPAARHSRIHCPGPAGFAGPAGSTVHERSSCPSSVKLSEDAWTQGNKRWTCEYCI